MVLTLAACGAAPGFAHAQPVPAPAEEYRNWDEGVSLQAPSGGQRILEPSPTRLVGWRRVDPMTGEEQWRFNVIRIAHTEPVTDLSAYAAHRMDDIRGEDPNEVFRFAPVQYRTLNERAAFELQVESTDKVKTWQRMLWVQMDPRRFLVFSLAGPPARQDDLNRLLDSILKTVSVHDPAAWRADRKGNLQRGEQWLEQMTQERLVQALDREPRWLLVRRGDKPVGFQVVRERPHEQAGRAGVEVESWAMFRPSAEEVQLVHRELFTTADRVLEVWRDRLQTGDGDAAVTVWERGMAANAAQVVVDLHIAGRPSTIRADVPPEHYLPRALAALLPRLVDLQAPTTYGFAFYNTETNETDYRTVTVHPAEEKAFDGRVRVVHRLLDQMRSDTPPITLWVDAQGRLLRMENAAGLVMAPAEREEVLRHFPNAEAVIRALNRMR